MVGVTLLHRKGYFFQRLDDAGRQYEDPVAWPIDDFLSLMDATCQVQIEGRQVSVRALCRHHRGFRRGSAGLPP